MVTTRQNNLAGSHGRLDVQGDSRKRRQRRLRLFLVWLITLATLLPVLTIAGYLVGAQQYERDKTLGNAGEQDLHTAVNLLSNWSKRPFNLAPVYEAQEEFNTTGVIMSQVRSDLQALPGIIGLVPALSTRLAAASHLLAAAQGVSQAGSVGCQLLENLAPAFSNPLGTHGQGLTTANFKLVDQLFPQIRAGLLEALDNADQIQTADLSFDPHLAQTFSTFQHDLPLARTLLNDLTEILPALPTLLGVGQPANYLLEVLDSTELRPGGGFIGNDGAVTISGGRFEGAHIQDVLIIDKAVKLGTQYIPFPAKYNWLHQLLKVPGWSLRDSNLDADFPTDALNGEENYDREGGQVAFQGVVAITPALIQNVLEITGPVAMPQYNETVTAQNLIALIHYHQLGAGSEGNSLELAPGGQTSLRKHFTELLAESLMARIHHLSAAQLGKFVGLASSSLQTKDVQIYLNNPMAENLLQDLHMADTIQAPAGDSLFVVDANITGDKANEFILTTMQDQVTLDDEGNAQHHLDLTYAWTIPGPIYGRAYYQDYLRVYVPPGSVLEQSQGWQYLGQSEAFGREVWAGYFRLDYQQTLNINLTWTVPHAATRLPNGTGWQYNYLLQHQAGIYWTAGMQWNLTGCTTFKNATDGLSIAHAQQEIWSKRGLKKDQTLSTQYACGIS
jgi:hypothetical protein